MAKKTSRKAKAKKATKKICASCHETADDLDENDICADCNADNDSRFGADESAEADALYDEYE